MPAFLNEFIFTGLDVCILWDIDFVIPKDFIDKS
jgi:hypothetical protein